MRWTSAGVPLFLMAAVFSACGGPGSPADPVATSAGAIQGGTLDSSHSFVVAIMKVLGSAGGAVHSGGFAICSGALLAPNLVATARHCVSDLPSPMIDCASSSFGAVSPPSDLFVTADATIGTTPPFAVAKIVVPSGANQTAVCGNDIALLILAQPIDLPLYVTPAINPPITNHVAYSTSVTAIGYGITSPADTSGTSAGARRIRQKIGILCIPNDPASALNCYKTDRTAPQYLAANEFVSGDGTCEGDSGSSAFDQGSFDQGKWVSFGVLSRGGVSMEGGTCTEGIYTRFDAWASLLTSTAMEAAATGGYPAPSWAGGPAANCSPSKTLCNGSADCCSNNCLSRDQGRTFVCSMCDCANPCDTGLACQSGVCVALAPGQSGPPSCADASAPSAEASASPVVQSPVAAPGCACALARSPRAVPPSALRFGALAAMLAAARRRRRHGAGQLSESRQCGARERQ